MKKDKSKGSNWGYSGLGMHKHAVSGVSHNHANSIARTRDYNRDLERQAELKKKQKTPLYPSIKDVFPH